MRSRKPGANRSTWRVTSSVGSRVDPAGTWMYAHSTCLPSGARVGSSTDGCTASTYGRSVHRAARDGVLARLHLGARAAEVDGGRACDIGMRPRDRAVQREVDLRGAGPVAVAPDRPRVRRRQVGVGEQQTRRGVEQQQVSGIRIAPVQPVERRHLMPRLDRCRRGPAGRRRARRRCAARPRAGRPSRRPRARARRGAGRTRPRPRRESGVFACASTPASSAFASSVANVPRPSRGAELQAAQAEADRGDRMPRHAQQLRTGEIHERRRDARLSGRRTARHARPSRPRPSAVRSRSRHAIAAGRRRAAARRRPRARSTRCARAARTRGRRGSSARRDAPPSRHRAGIRQA